LPADPFNVFDTERRRLVGVVVVVDMMVRSSRVSGWNRASEQSWSCGVLAVGAPRRREPRGISIAFPASGPES
jgi:hypothetical protein